MAIGSAQLAEWLAYQKIRGPLGPQRWDLYFARIMHVLSALGGATGDPSGYLPKWRRDRRLDSPAEFFDAVMAQMETPDDDR